MNTTLRYSAYVALLLGSTSIALADGGRGSDLSGLFTVGGGLASFESTDDVDVNDLVLNGAASVNVQLAKDWSFQVDVLGEQVAVNHNNTNDQYLSAQAIGGHVTWHKPGTGSLGIFTGFGTASDQHDESQSGAIIGVEGQLYFNEITLYAQAAALDISDHDDDNGLNSSAYLVRGVARYFFNDNLKVEGELARVDSDDFDGCCGSSGDTVEGTEWGLLVQGRLTDGQVYGTLAYRGGNYEENTHDEADLRMVTVAVSFMFGPDSLKANDRAGNTLETPLMAWRSAGAFEAID